MTVYVNLGHLEGQDGALLAQGRGQLLTWKIRCLRVELAGVGREKKIFIALHWREKTARNVFKAFFGGGGVGGCALLVWLRG